MPDPSIGLLPYNCISNYLTSIDNQRRFSLKFCAFLYCNLSFYCHTWIWRILCLQSYIRQTKLPRGSVWLACNPRISDDPTRSCNSHHSRAMSFMLFSDRLALYYTMLANNHISYFGNSLVDSCGNNFDYLNAHGYSFLRASYAYSFLLLLGDLHWLHRDGYYISENVHSGCVYGINV